MAYILADSLSIFLKAFLSPKAHKFERERPNLGGCELSWLNPRTFNKESLLFQNYYCRNFFFYHIIGHKHKRLAYIKLKQSDDFLLLLHFADITSKQSDCLQKWEL